MTQPDLPTSYGEPPDLDRHECRTCEGQGTVRAATALTSDDKQYSLLTFYNATDLPEIPCPYCKGSGWELKRVPRADPNPLYEAAASFVVFLQQYHILSGRCMFCHSVSDHSPTCMGAALTKAVEETKP